MSKQSEECCPEVPLTNPKTQLSKSRSCRSSNYFGNISNPITEEVKDTDTLRKFFENFSGILVPYAGTCMDSSHSLLHLFTSLCTLSPTRGAVIQSIHDFSFSTLNIVQKTDPAFNINKSRPLTVEEKCDFVDFVKTNIVWHRADGRECTIEDFNSFVFKSYKESGNAFVELVLTETLGVKKAHVYAKKTSHCLFLSTQKGQPKEVVTSPIWTETYLKKHTPERTLLFPDFSINERLGVKRTMFHLKNGTNVWYGRPEAEASTQPQYLEYQQYDYLNKETANRFTGQMIMEIEDADPDKYGLNEDAIGAGFGSLGHRINENFSAGKDFQTVFLMSRPAGAKPMTTTSVSANTNENWYKTIGEMLKQSIIDGESWSVNFMNSSASKGFQTAAFQDEYLNKIKPIIRKNQKVTNNLLNTIIGQVAEFFNAPEMLEMCFEWMDSIEGDLGAGEDVRKIAETYGIAARAGLITAQKEDEAHFRALLGLPEIGEEVSSQWDEEGNTYRKPTTLKNNEKTTNPFEDE